MVFHTPARPMEVDEVVYRSDLVAIGRFRATPDRPLFRDSGPAERAIFVFPRSSVVIRHEGRPSFAADPCTVTFYNRGQRYTREPLDPRGDASEWFSIRPDALVAALASVDPGVADRPDQPFTAAYGPTDSSTYMLQRSLVEYVSGRADVDRFLVEERVLDLFERVACRDAGGGCGDGAASDRATGLAEDVRRYLGSRYTDEDLRLEDIADAVGSSVFHLCRVFRRETGLTIHRYRLQLRLRTALELVAERGVDLSRVAFQLGFSSHSHFTASFRRLFATTPSAFRRAASTRTLRRLARFR